MHAFKGGVRADYAYTADGLRASQTVNNITSRWVWDGTRLVKDGDTNYYYGANLISSSMGNYYVFNGHGDVVALTNEKGEKVKEYSYSAFGIEYDPDWADSNPFRYCGEYYDKGTGSIYLRARTYDPTTGRFTQQDPAQDGLNWYVYCYNNPVNLFDPSGLAPYDKFESPDEAAKDWAQTFYGASDYVAFECASLIFMDWDENGNVYYSYTYGVWGDPHKVTPSDAMQYVPNNAVVFSAIHSHPNNPEFSGPDKDYAINRSWSAYVVARGFSGVAIKKWSSTRRGYMEQTIVKNLTIKPLSTQRKRELKNKFQSKWNAHIQNDCSKCRYNKWPRE